MNWTNNYFLSFQNKHLVPRRSKPNSVCNTPCDVTPLSGWLDEAEILRDGQIYCLPYQAKTFIFRTTDD